MRTIPVDTQALNLLAAVKNARAAFDYVDGARGAQSQDDNGVPLWSVTLMTVGEDAAETITVKFPSAIEPSFDLMKPVKVTGLVARPVGDKVYFRADALSQSKGQ